MERLTCQFCHFAAVADIPHLSGPIVDGVGSSLDVDTLWTVHAVQEVAHLTVQPLTLQSRIDDEEQE